MSDTLINYDNFQPDWWDAAGATAEAVKTEIAMLVDSVFGPGGISDIQKQAIELAATKHYEAQQAMKAAGEAATRAASYADSPDSPLFKDAVASRIAYENIAKNSVSEAGQLMRNAAADAALVSKLATVVNVLGPAINTVQLGAAAASGDAYVVGQKAVGVLAGMALGALAVTTMSIIGAPLLLTGGVAITAGFAGGKVWEWMWENGAADYYGIKKGDEFSFAHISESIADLFNSSQSFIPIRRDPLILDLDNDGLETVGPAQSGVKFDHDADGIKTGTGWVKPDDGFLVMDRNNNGVIDNGRELFGDATLLYAGGTAADGFAALAQEDSNSDGKVDGADANWSKLRVWRDLNQDGVSQSNELFTMANAGIASVKVTKTVNSVTLANGNQLADLGTYTKTDGAAGTLGETSQLADVNLGQDTFHSAYTDQIAIDDDVKPLPDMRGSGLVRDLRQAASLDSVAGNALKAKLAAFAAATTGTQQKALMDDLLLAWADTSPLIARMQDRKPAQVNVAWSSSTVQAQWESKLHILEAFNGRYFFALPGDTQAGALTGLTVSAPDAQGKVTATVNLASG